MSRVPVLRYLPGERIQCSRRVEPDDMAPSRGIGIGVAISVGVWALAYIVFVVAIWGR